MLIYILLQNLSKTHVTGKQPNSRKEFLETTYGSGNYSRQTYKRQTLIYARVQVAYATGIVYAYKNSH